MVFARLRKCAPHVIMLLLAHPSPQRKQHLDWFSHFVHVTALSSVMLGHVLSSKNCVFMCGDLVPHLVHDSLGQPKSKSQTASRFSRFCTAHGRDPLYFITGRPFSPLKLPLPMGELNRHLIHGFMCPPESLTQTAS